MSVQLRHKALAEGHYLSVGFAFGIKIGAALAAADRKARQGILEYLLKAKELDDSKIYGRMQAQSTLIRPDRAVELHAVSGIYLNLSLIIYPRHTEDHLTLRIYQSLQQGIFSVSFLIRFDHNSEGFQNLLHRLMEFRLRGIFLNHLSDNLVYIRHLHFLLLTLIKNPEQNELFRAFRLSCPFFII